jgi:pimeloyl-ACP methyl ester carboxylesterase
VGFVGREQSRKRGGRRFKVHRPDGVVLDAWFSPAPRKTLPLQDDMPEPGRRGRGVRLPVVMAHGLMETKERHFKRAWNLNARGHDVVLFDHRGHGGSTFRSLTFGVEEKHDMAAVIDEAQRRGLIPGGGKVLTMGFSLGGGTVLQHAAIDDRVAGVIALAPFADFRGAIESFRRTLAPWVNRDWLNAGFESACDEAGFHLDEASAVEAFRQIDVPVLLAEGGQDPFLPGVDHVHRLAAAKPDGELVLVRIDEASHNALVRKTWPKLELAIGRFARVVSEAEGVVRSQESVVGSR